MSSSGPEMTFAYPRLGPLVEIESLRSLDFEKDTYAKTPNLDEFINSISKRKGEVMKGNFTPRYPLPEFENIADWSHWDNTETPDLSALSGAWCDRRLSNFKVWLDSKLQQTLLDACTALWRAMGTYESLEYQPRGRVPHGPRDHGVLGCLRPARLQSIPAPPRVRPRYR